MLTTDIDHLIKQYTRLTTSYKVVNGHEITVDVLIPHTLPGSTIKSSRKPNTGVPVIARFHGGGLVSGASLYTGFLAAWNFHYAQRHSAVMVLPNYRFLPESNAANLLEDLSDFWSWVNNDLQKYVFNWAPGCAVDLSKVIVMGDSAGGYFAIQSGFMAKSLEPAITIRGIIAPFPMIDLEDPWFTMPSCHDVVKFAGQPTVPYAVVDDHFKAMHAKGKLIPVSEDWNLERMALIVAVIRHGTFKQFFLGSSQDLDDFYPMRRLRSATSFPPLFIMHGRQDSFVQAAGSVRFISTLRARIPLAETRLEIGDGEHGFGNQDGINSGWLAAGLSWFDEKVCLGKGE
jgi:acetyl esterase/lipase